LGAPSFPLGSVLPCFRRDKGIRMTLDSPGHPSPHAEDVLPLPRAGTFDPADLLDEAE